MTNILIIGATGSFGSALRATLQDKTDFNVTLFSRSAGKLLPKTSRETVMAGDATDIDTLRPLVQNSDYIFSAVSGQQIIQVTQNLVALTKQTNKHVILVSSLGIYNEIPQSMGAEWNLDENSILKPYRKAADLVESGVNHYTIIRPGWIKQGQPAPEYEVTEKGNSFGDREVSPANLAHLVDDILQDPHDYDGRNLGINDN